MNKLINSVCIIIAVACGLYAISARHKIDIVRTEMSKLQTDISTARVLKRAIDGDTIELENGERVRIIGVSAPETWERKGKKWTKKLDADPNGIKAFEYVKSFEGQKIRLSFEKDKYDRYKRTLAHVYIIGEDIDLGATLIKKGWCKVMCFKPNTARYGWYKALYREAVSKTEKSIAMKTE